jgi:hypothetical protein
MVIPLSQIKHVAWDQFGPLEQLWDMRRVPEKIEFPPEIPLWKIEGKLFAPCGSDARRRSKKLHKALLTLWCGNDAI